jgi:hypothetical protein
MSTEQSNLPTSNLDASGASTDSAGASPPPKPDCDADVDPKDPAKQLAVLRGCLDDAQKKEKAEEGKVQRYNAQATALSALLDEIEKTKTDYDKEQRRLEDDQKGYETFSSNEQQRLKNELGSSFEKIATTVAPFKKIIDDLSGAIPKEEHEIADLEEKLIKDKQSEADAKADFEKWKKPVASIVARHGKLKMLSDKINAATKNGERAFAYWLLTTTKAKPQDEDRFADALAGVPQVVASKDLSEKIIKAWNAYAKATKAVQDRDSEIKGRKEALDTKKSELDDAKKKFDARVQAALSTVKPA